MKKYRHRTVESFTMQAGFKQLEALGETLEQFLQKAQDMPDSAYNHYAIKLAVHELVTNIIRHAYANRVNETIDVQLALCQGEFMITLFDTGCQFVRQDVPDPDLDNGQEGGYGMFLIEQIMDEVVYQSSATGNMWKLVKQWE